MAEREKSFQKNRLKGKLTWILHSLYYLSHSLSRHSPGFFFSEERVGRENESEKNQKNQKTEKKRKEKEKEEKRE